MGMTTHHDHDGGLALDLPHLLSRRRMLGLGGAGVVALLAGCGDGAGTAAEASSTPTPIAAGGPGGPPPGGAFGGVPR